HQDSPPPVPVQYPVVERWTAACRLLIWVSAGTEAIDLGCPNITSGPTRGSGHEHPAHHGGYRSNQLKRATLHASGRAAGRPLSAGTLHLVCLRLYSRTRGRAAVQQ